MCLFICVFQNHILRFQIIGTDDHHDTVLDAKTMLLCQRSRSKSALKVWGTKMTSQQSISTLSYFPPLFPFTVSHTISCIVYVQILSSWLICNLWWCTCISVERYDPRTNRWTPVSPMGTRRKHLGVAVYNNMIYAVGGRDDTTELSSAERYSPQTNSWQPVVAMTSRRSGVSRNDST